MSTSDDFIPLSRRKLQEKKAQKKSRRKEKVEMKRQASTIFTWNFPKGESLTKESLKELFSQFGSIIFIKLVKQFKKPNGTAYVVFSSPQEADNALKMDNKIIYGEKNMIRICKVQNKPNFKKGGEPKRVLEDSEDSGVNNFEGDDVSSTPEIAENHIQRQQQKKQQQQQQQQKLLSKNMKEQKTVVSEPPKKKSKLDSGKASLISATKPSSKNSSKVATAALLENKDEDGDDVVIDKDQREFDDESKDEERVNKKNKSKGIDAKKNFTIENKHQKDDKKKKKQKTSIASDGDKKVGNSSHDELTSFRKVVVKNLSLFVKESQLRTFFSICGNIEKIIFPTFNDHRSKGYAFVIFTSEKAKDKAILMNGKNLKGKPIIVEEVKK